MRTESEKIMAEPKITIPISLEKVVHSTIKEIIQGIWDDQNLLVSDIKINWIDTSSQGKPNFIIQNVVMTTQTIDKVRPDNLF